MLSSVSWHYSGELWNKSRSWNQSIWKILKLWMNEWCIYIAIYCVLLYTKSALQSCGGGGGSGSLLNHHQCAASNWRMRRLPQDNDTSALATHQLQVQRRESHRANQVDALATHRPTGGEERDIEPIKCMRSPHTSYRWRGESHRANQVYALATHQLQVERRET